MVWSIDCTQGCSNDSEVQKERPSSTTDENLQPLVLMHETVEVSMHNTRTRLLVLALSGPLWIATLSPAQAPDNSAHNKQHDVTADQQSNSASDRAITQKIRKALMADKSLSTDAHNVKIITTNGAVTLKGPVKSEDEKQQVASKAAEIVDASKIDNQLSVKGQ